jgi:hypothetical protein
MPNKNKILLCDGRLRSTSSYGGKNCQQLAALIVVSLYFFPWEPVGLYDNFNPILGFAGFALADSDSTPEIRAASGTVGFPIIGAN